MFTIARHSWRLYIKGQFKQDEMLISLCRRFHQLVLWPLHYLSETIAKVVLVVSGEGIDPVLQKPQSCPLAGPSEVSLQGSRAGVLSGDHVCVVCPYLLKCILFRNYQTDLIADLRSFSWEMIISKPDEDILNKILKYFCNNWFN